MDKILQPTFGVPIERQHDLSQEQMAKLTPQEKIHIGLGGKLEDARLKQISSLPGINFSAQDASGASGTNLKQARRNITAGLAVLNSLDNPASNTLR